MNVCVSVQNRFAKTGDGVYWSKTGYAYEFWQRYLTTFDEVLVLGRTQEVSEVSDEWKRSNGPRVKFIPLPYYEGFAQFIQSSLELRRSLKAALNGVEALIFRLPSPYLFFMLGTITRRQKPFGVEVLGDPHDLYSPGTYPNPFLGFIRMISRMQLAKECKCATTAIYVTKTALQKNYPCSGYVVHASDVALTKESFTLFPRDYETKKLKTRSLLFVGSLQHLQKGPDVLIDAVRLAVAHGRDLKLTIVGDGEQKSRIEKLAASFGLHAVVQFAGHFPKPSDLIPFFDNADLFILPSRAEGLPKVLIEAMARGLPCISTRVGGIPELLEAEDIVPPGDSEELYRKILQVIEQPARMTAMSRRNWEFAKNFDHRLLEPRFQDFLVHLKNQTQSWLQRK